MEAVIRALHPRDLRAAGSLLARAFADDPVIGSFLQGGLRRPLAYPVFFRAVVREARQVGHAFGAYEDGLLIGVAAWVPPEPRTLARSERVRLLAERLFVRSLFPRGMRAIDIGFAGLARSHPSEPHWYLAFVGVEPASQSRGIGSRLLRPVLETADAADVACYLETPFPGTFRYYENLGFVRREETRTFPGAPPVWTFMRAPRS